MARIELTRGCGWRFPVCPKESRGTNQILIIQGMDGLGKTPLAYQFERAGWQYVKVLAAADLGNIDPLKRASDHVQMWHSSVSRNIHQKLVYDRFPIPDMLVYDFLDKRLDNDTEYVVRDALNAMLTYDIWFLELYPREGEGAFLKSGRGDSDGVVGQDKIAQVFQGYDHLRRTNIGYRRRHARLKEADEGELWTPEDARIIERKLWPL